jgi:HEAT repeat protein
MHRLSSFVLIILSAATVSAKAPHPVQPTAAEDGQIAVLTSTASVADKDAACRELKTVGTEKSIPALAALLTNEKLAHPARFALESMPYASAGAALRDAVGKTKGLIRSGMIDSLGERRDTSAVQLIANALNDSDDRVVTAAARALGKIGTKDAAKALQAAHSKASGSRRAAIGQGLVLCANKLLKAGKTIEETDDALYYFGAAGAAVTAGEPKVVEPKAVSFAAVAGFLRARVSEQREAERLQYSGPIRMRVDEIVRPYLDNNDAVYRAAGASMLPDLSTDELAAIATVMSKMPASSQIAVLSAARIRSDHKLLSAALDGLKSDHEAVRVAAIRALGMVGDASALPPLVQFATKDGEIGKAAQDSIALLKGRDIDLKIIDFLKAEKDPQRRAAWIDVLAFRRPEGSTGILMAEAVSSDPTVRGHAMTALAQMAAPSDLAGMIAGVLAAQPGAERDAAERAVMLLLAQVKPAGQRGVQVLAAIDASPGDHLALLPLAARFGGKDVLARITAALGNADPQVHKVGLHALCNWPNNSVAAELLRQIDAAKDPALRTMLLRAYSRVVSTPPTGPNAQKNAAQKDAQRLAGLKKAMGLAQQDDERAYILERASAIRTLDSLRFVLPYVDQSALAEPACAAVAELAHHKELRDVHKPEFRPAIEKVLQTTKVQAVIDNCKRSRDMMNEK